MNLLIRRRHLRWFQFRLRDLLLLTAICAVLFGWWSDRERLREEVLRLQGDAVAQSAGHDQLLARVNLYRTVLIERGVLPDREGSRVGGLVTRICDPHFVEINVGADDGLKPGEQLDVWRPAYTVTRAKFLGRIRLTMVNQLTSIGNVMYATAPIEVDDHALTPLE